MAVVETRSAIATIDVATSNGDTCHALDLGKRRGQRVTITGIAPQAHHAEDEPSRLVVVTDKR